MEEELRQEFCHLDEASLLALIKASKKMYMKAIDRYNTILKFNFITTDDLNNADVFFDYVDEIANAMKGADVK